MGFFKLHFFGSHHHVLLKIILRNAQLSFQNLVDLGYFLFVVFRGLQIHTRPFAALEVVFHAHFILSCLNVFLRQIERTGAQRKQLAKHIKQVVHSPDISKRSVIRSRFFVHASRHFHPRKRLIKNLDKGIRLVVAEENVKTRLIALDELIFKQ